jgi:hypothetical protein
MADDGLITLIFAAIRVSEVDNAPMSAHDIAFMLDLPREEVDRGLGQLIKDGSVFEDGNLYRCDLRRELTISERRRIQDLLDGFEAMVPDRLPARLDS